MIKYIKLKYESSRFYEINLLNIGNKIIMHKTYKTNFYNFELSRYILVGYHYNSDTNITY